MEVMRVALATGLYPPEIGGPATYALMLESELPARGIEVETVPFGWVRGYPKVVRHIVYAWKLWRASKGADIIYALDPVSVGLPSLLVAKIRRKKFILRIPGDYAWEQGQLRFGVTDRLHVFIDKRLEYGFRVSLLCRIESFVAKRALHVIVPSSYMKTVVEKWGCDSDSISIIYSALHPLEVGQNRSTLRDQFDYKYPTLVSAGRLVPNKGFLELIRVFASLRSQYTRAQLVIIGDGPQREELLAAARALEVADSVRLLGQLSKDALGAAIKAADVFVLNTAHEGLSHQLIEVMDLGVPIVTTSVGGNPELITNGIQGYLVPFNDQERLAEAIGRVLDHPESRERMTQSARARSKDFEKGKVVEQLAQLLHSVYAKELT